jgi:hypothetical protein
MLFANRFCDTPNSRKFNLNECLELGFPHRSNTAGGDFLALARVKIGDERYVIQACLDSYEIAADSLGHYRARLIETNAVSEPNDKAAIFRLADSVIRRDHDDKIRLLDTGACWRHDPPSDKQIDPLAAKIGREAIPENLTKGAAARALDAYYTRRRAS